jgi:hypothetical protein
MSLPIRWSGLLAGLTLLGITPLWADAQTRPRPASGSAIPPPAPAQPVVTKTGTPFSSVIPSLANQSINPIFRLGNGLTLPQTAFNTAVAGQALSQIPPAAFGINPFNAGLGFGNAGLGFGSALGVGGLGTAALAANPFAFGSASALGSGLGTAALTSSPLGAGASLTSSPYGGGYGAGGYGGGGYGYGGYGEDPYAGYLRGTADVTNSQGRYLSQVQQARLLQSQADMSKLDLRRRIIEDLAIERKGWLNPEADRVRGMEAAYARATHEAPITEILSGQALNDLYNHVYPLQQKAKAQDIGLPKVDVDEDMLKQVNLTGSGSLGSVALLKDRGKLTWPLVLQGSEYEKYRERLTALAKDAINKVGLNNPVGAATLRDMMGDVRHMNELLLHNVGELSPSEYVEAKRYLNSLESAVKALQDPNVGNQLNQNWAARAHNVAALVDFMGDKGLKFAPATAGDEPAYRHLYQRLVAYDAAVSSKMSSARKGD